MSFGISQRQAVKQTFLLSPLTLRDPFSLCRNGNSRRRRHRHHHIISDFWTVNCSDVEFLYANESGQEKSIREQTSVKAALPAFLLHRYDLETSEDSGHAFHKHIQVGMRRWWGCCWARERKDPPFPNLISISYWSTFTLLVGYCCEYV